MFIKVVIALHALTGVAAFGFIVAHCFVGWTAAVYGVPALFGFAAIDTLALVIQVVRSSLGERRVFIIASCLMLLMTLVFLGSMLHPADEVLAARAALGW